MSPTLFHSHVFLLLFLPAVMLLWHRAPLSTRGRLVAITAASYLFYGWWDWRFTTLMLFSTGVDYLAGARIHAAEAPATRRRWLLVSLATNLGLLGVFKYLGFAARSLNGLAAWAGLGAPAPVLEIVLPVGISFYTFQSMSYSIDLYLGKAEPTESFWHFAAYVSLFPQLVAGPIVRYTELEAQLRQVGAPIEARQVREGMQRFVLGLAKKLVIADQLAPTVDALWQTPGALDAVGAWAAVLGYAYQLYFDFSGYSDMAIGLGGMLGFAFPANFDSPYLAEDMSDFWRRWHITLGGWFRDYVYMPLAARLSRVRRLRRRPLTVASAAMMVSMTLCGLWHGASWNFVLWGAYHGLLLVVCQAWKSRGPFSLGRVSGRALTFVAVLLSFVLFRAPDLAAAAAMYASMFGARGASLATLGGHLPFLGDLAGAALLCTFAPNTGQLTLPTSRRSAVGLGLLLALSVMLIRKDNPFLYFQF